VLSRRHQPVHAHAKRRQIAAFGEIDRLACKCLAIVLQQLLQQDRCPVARPARPAGGISAFAFLKLHGLSPLSRCERIRRARPRLASAQQKTRRGLPPGRPGVVSVNTLFWKILVTRVKRKMVDASVVSLWCCPNSGFARRSDL